MWYYIEEGQQRGPVTDADLEALRMAGKINVETMVWREGMANWQPLRIARPASGAAIPPIGAPTGTGLVVCSQCGGQFQASEVIHYGSAAVCAACKPIFLQKLKEGASFGGGGGSGGSASEAEVRERDYEHDVSGYLSKAWALFKADAGSLIAATVLVGLCIVVANVIPYLSMITGIVFTGPLLGGLFAFYLKKNRSEPAALGDAFSGFGPRFGQLLLARFIPSLLAGLALIPVAIIAVVIIVMSASANRHGGDPFVFGAPMIIGGVVLLAGLCVMIYLQYCWMFTLWLVVDKNMTFWPAMSLSRAVVRKHWWQTFWLGIVCGLLLMLGGLLCLVGMLVTGPLCLAMWAQAYERLFGDLRPD